MSPQKSNWIGRSPLFLTAEDKARLLSVTMPPTFGSDFLKDYRSYNFVAIEALFSI